MFERIFNEALASAHIDPNAFDAAIKKDRFKSRVDWFLRGAPASLVDAYNENVLRGREAATRSVA
jgi:hypothetical protein